MTVKGAYKMVKIVDTQTTKPYPVTAGSAKEKHTVNVEFQCLHDGARYVKLNLFSNSPITEAEFIAFSQVNPNLLSKGEIAKKLNKITKILKKDWTAEDLDKVTAKRLTRLIQTKNFQKIASIPYEVSRLTLELEVIRKKEYET